SSVGIPASCGSGTPNASSDVSPTVVHPDLPATSTSFLSSGSNSVTPTSASSTPGSTPTSSLVILHPHLTPPNHPASKAELNEPHASLDTKPPHDFMPVDVEPAYCNSETTGTGDCLDAFPHTLCHSLPFPAHHSRRRCDALPMHSEYFATDSGLLLPSRRRKSRPMANLAFSQSAYRVGQTHSPLSSLSSGAFTYQSEIPADASQNDSEPEHPAGCVALGGCPSTGGESRSSGYQSHSRQSSLESQAVGLNTAMNPTIVPLPLENLSNCLIEPPDSDESDSAFTETVATDTPDTMDRTLVNPTVGNPLLSSDIALLTNSTQPSSCIDRILESIHVTTTTDPFPVQPYRPSSARSPIMGAHLPNLSKQIPIGEHIFWMEKGRAHLRRLHLLLNLF
ncbi:hypothetical protein AHF37_06999, partial [Paragonimus kellicotti]